MIRVYVIGATNCLAGDTLVGVNRSGRSFNLCLSELHRMQHGGRRSFRAWDLSIPTKVRMRDEQGAVVLAEVIDTFDRGARQVVRVRTVGGRDVLTTPDHLFLADSGWVEAGRLRKGDKVYVDGGVTPSQSHATRRYRALGGMQHHPYRARHTNRARKRTSYTIQTHRLVYEAFLDGMPFSAFLTHVRAGQIEGLQFINPALYRVHHKDGDTLNNSLSNLDIAAVSDHLREHGNVNWRNVTAKTVLDTVAAVTCAGDRTVYDVTVNHPLHNFLANGFVVHNCGKSTLMDLVRRDPTQGTVEVGKMMRAKYPPEHFAGRSNPAHTAAEAWQMYLDGVAAAEAAGKKAVWIDGQPRDMEQMRQIISTPSQRLFLHLWASQEVREQRARARDTDPERLALSLARLQGDLPAIYDILANLLLLRETVLHVHADDRGVSADLVRAILEGESSCWGAS